ncbi:MAG: aldo/keto reductase [Phycisphaerae bacterium]|nr:aldo/keto reductase [Phycisphaerae bacterium]
MEDKKLNRREFIKTAAGAGLASAIASGTVLAAAIDANKPSDANKPNKQKEKYPQVPMRKLGRSNKLIPALSLGIMFDAVENQIVLHKAYQWGVTYWDTSHGYAGGKSEEGIGKFLAKYPNRRKDLFIVSKASGARTSQERDERLKTSFERMNTDYVDLYYGVHGLQDPADLNDNLKNWAAKAKAEGKIKYFGFSTHKNMAECLKAASKCDWIDAIMTSYNYRLIQDTKLNAGIEACSKAGIALIAMKIQAYTAESENEKTMHQRFIVKGFSDAQAKIKAVLQDKRICCACVGMKNVATVTSNVAAVLDKTDLSKEDLNFLDSYAKQTCTGYCAACGLCDLAVPQMPYVSDVMRSMMYHNNYGDTALAKETFMQVASKVSSSISSFDYSRAEAVCPNKIAIADMMAKAEKLLA